MRSGGGVSTLTNNTPKEQEQKKDGKCKGATTIPIFLKSKFYGTVLSVSHYGG